MSPFPFNGLLSLELVLSWFCVLFTCREFTHKIWPCIQIQVFFRFCSFPGNDPWTFSASLFASGLVVLWPDEQDMLWIGHPVNISYIFLIPSWSAWSLDYLCGRNRLLVILLNLFFPFLLIRWWELTCSYAAKDCVSSLTLETRVTVRAGLAEWIQVEVMDAISWSGP